MCAQAVGGVFVGGAVVVPLLVIDAMIAMLTKLREDQMRNAQAVETADIEDVNGDQKQWPDRKGTH